MKNKILNTRPPRLAMFYLLIAMLISFLSPRGTIFFFPYSFVGTACFVAGFTIMMWAWSLFQKEKTEVCPLSAANKAFIIRGPYRFTRNPQYLGMCLMLLGIAFLVGNLPMFMAPFAFFVSINNVFIPFEEAKMTKQYGEKFNQYKNKVRMWL